MANREKAARVIEHYTVFVQSNYPAHVTTANTERLARLRGMIKETFAIASGDTLDMKVEGNAESVTLTSGTRTSTQVAADVNTASIGVTAVDDGQGRLQLTSDTVPADGQGSSLVIAQPTSGTAHTTLGFKVGDADYRELIATPNIRTAWAAGRQTRTFPDHEIMSYEWNPDTVRSGLDEILLSIRIQDASPMGNEMACIEKVLRHFDIVDEIIEADRTAEEEWIFSEVDNLRGVPHAWELLERNEKGKPTPVAIIGELTMSVRIQVRGY